MSPSFELFRPRLLHHATTFLQLSLAATIAVLVMACSERRAADPCCTFAETKDTPDGQGLLQVRGSTSAYFDVLNESGHPLQRQTLNSTLTLDEGKYRVKVNNSVHIVEIEAGELATCSTGTLIVSGNTSEYYQLIDSTGQLLAQEVLGKSMSCFPGIYTVRVNNTDVSAEVKYNELTELRTGSIRVSGTTGEYYYVLGKGNKQLNYSTLEKALSFLPGTYDVKVNNTTMTAEILSGQVTELVTGNLLVTGLTDEHYYVTDSAGNALNYQTLNQPLAFFPGNYQVKVNNTVVTGSIAPGKTTEFTTGSLMLTGGGTAYYYVLDELGNELNYNSLNKSLSFFPSEYTVRLGTSTRKATVVAGQLTAINVAP